MSLAEDERWRAVPPSQVLPWLLTIRNVDGSFRTPTKEEIDVLLASPERIAELEDALNEACEVLRGYVSATHLELEEAQMARVQKWLALVNKK